MKKIIPFIFIFMSTAVPGQHQADNWYFGWNAGLTFSTNPPSYISGGQTYVYEGTSSISDANGNLLFYSDGEKVWDRNHNLMPNGSGLGGSFSSTQSCIIFPAPGSDSLYYLFTAPETLTPDSFAYNIIDMSLNNGLGAVTVKNAGLLKPATEKLTAVHHLNGADVWVIGHKSGTADYYAWLVTASGVNPMPVISTIGIVYSGNTADGQGYLRASPCGNKIASALATGAALELFDFDNLTGGVSNQILLGSWPFLLPYGPYGIEFSPDNTKLYASFYNPPTILQYDLSAGSPAAIIASEDTIAIPSGPWGGAMQTGPDGKIYFSKFQGTSLGCIHSPNLLGQACNLTDNYISISPSPGRPGLPNFLTSYFCNLAVNTKELTPAILSLYPNPATISIHVRFNSGTSSVQLKITNILGELVYSNVITAGNYVKEMTIPLLNFQPGVYGLSIQSKNGVEIRKFLVN